MAVRGPAEARAVVAVTGSSPLPPPARLSAIVRETVLDRKLLDELGDALGLMRGGSKYDATVATSIRVAASLTGELQIACQATSAERAVGACELFAQTTLERLPAALQAAAERARSIGAAKRAHRLADLATNYPALLDAAAAPPPPVFVSFWDDVRKIKTEADAKPPAAPQLALVTRAAAIALPRTGAEGALGLSALALGTGLVIGVAGAKSRAGPPAAPDPESTGPTTARTPPASTPPERVSSSPSGAMPRASSWPPQIVPNPRVGSSSPPAQRISSSPPGRHSSSSPPVGAARGSASSSPPAVVAGPGASSSSPPPTGAAERSVSSSPPAAGGATRTSSSLPPAGPATRRMSSPPPAAARTDAIAPLPFMAVGQAWGQGPGEATQQRVPTMLPPAAIEPPPNTMPGLSPAANAPPSPTLDNRGGSRPPIREGNPTPVPFEVTDIGPRSPTPMKMPVRRTTQMLGSPVPPRASDRPSSRSSSAMSRTLMQGSTNSRYSFVSTPPPTAGTAVRPYDVGPEWAPDPRLDAGPCRALSRELFAFGVEHCFTVVVCCIPGIDEERSVLTASLALALTATGNARVLVVDANTDRPALHQLFRATMPPGQNLSRQLQAHMMGQAPDHWSVLRCSKALHLLIDCADSTPGLIPTRSFEKCVRGLRSYYDFILFDGPSGERETECRALDGVSDGLIVVCTEQRRDEIAKTSRCFTPKRFSKAIRVGTDKK